MVKFNKKIQSLIFKNNFRFSKIDFFSNSYNYLTNKGTPKNNIDSKSKIMDMSDSEMNEQDLLQKTTVKYSDVVNGKNISPVRKLKQTNMVHRYALRGLPPNGFSYFIKNKFKSINMCVINRIKRSGVSIPSLTLGFTDRTDFRNAQQFSCNLNGRLITFEAEKADVSDCATLVCEPKVAKNMFLSNVPYEIVTGDQQFVNLFAPLAEFDIENVTLSLVNGVFEGQMVIPVTKYIRKPPKLYEIALVCPVTDTSIEDTNVVVRIFATGVPLTEGLEQYPEPEFKLLCYYCKSVGHERKDCPKLKSGGVSNGTRCKICGFSSSGCTRKKCKNIADVVKGNLNRETVGNNKKKSPFEYKEGSSSLSNYL